MKKRNNSGTEIENPIVFSSIAGQRDDLSGQKNVIKSNLSIFWIIFNLVFLIIVGRVFYLQVFKGDYYRKVAENNRIKNIEIKAPRGLIVDMNGEILASNVPSFDLIFYPNEIPKNQTEREKIYSKLGKEFDLNDNTIKAMIEGVGLEDSKKYLLKEDIDYEKALILIEKLKSFPGIYLEKTARRKYEKGEALSSILGYAGKINQTETEDNPDYSLNDYIGKNGLELTYEELLKGKHGIIKMEVNSDGSVKEELGVVPPITGNKLILNIDADLQQKGYDILGEILEVNEQATGASIVAINPKNGSVRALVSYPSYDNNLFAEGIGNDDYNKLVNDPRKPLVDKSISGSYPPGSVYKPILAAIGLEEGIVNPDTTLNCTGSISVGSWVFRDWKTHGLTDLNKAIAESCNLYFYAIGGGWGNTEGLGVSRMSKYSKYFGLGTILGIDIPSEASGTLPNSEWKFKNIGDKWYIGDSYHMSIGQGFMSTTPLQIAVATSVIANGGVLYQPQIVDKSVDYNNHEMDIKPKIIRNNFIEKENLEKVRVAMRETVINGSGARLADMKTEVAGKTGTAQFGILEKTHSWFVSFAPFDDPEIVTAVLIESGGEGHDWAVPATEQFLRKYFEEQEEEIDWQKIENTVKNRVVSEANY
jgi:penicillin-binding protein 2